MDDGKGANVPPEWLSNGGLLDGDPSTFGLVEHLEYSILERDEKHYALSSVPPGGAKTSTIAYGLIKHLARWPTMPVGYFTHNDKLAHKVSRDIRRIVEDVLGWKLRGDSDAVGEWELEQGGGLVAGGLGGGVLGRRFRLLVVDDPYGKGEKARKDAERKKILATIDEDLKDRLFPGGALLVNHTRHDPNDAIGVLRKTYSWPWSNAKALSGVPGDTNRKVLWPGRWTVAELENLERKKPAHFAANYQGEPRHREGKIFRVDEEGLPPRFDLSRFAEFFPSYSVGYGLDLAASEITQKRGDASVLVKMARVRRPESLKRDVDGKLYDRDHYYFLNVVWRQIQAPDFLELAKNTIRTEAGPALWYRYGMEKAVAQFLTPKLPRLRHLAYPGGKVQRATPLSEAWNEGRVFVPFGPSEDHPKGVEWADDLIAEYGDFTGAEGMPDDRVDSGVGAYDLLRKKLMSSGLDPKYDAFLPHSRI